MKKRLFKIGFPTILKPNGIGEFVRETPRWIIIKLTKRTFEAKTSGTGNTHTFSRGERQWYKDVQVGKEFKFWKHNDKQVAGSAFIVYEIIKQPQSAWFSRMPKPPKFDDKKRRPHVPYVVNLSLNSYQFTLNARSGAEAMYKAMERLAKKKITSLINKTNSGAQKY